MQETTSPCSVVSLSVCLSVRKPGVVVQYEGHTGPVSGISCHKVPPTQVSLSEWEEVRVFILSHPPGRLLSPLPNLLLRLDSEVVEHQAAERAADYGELLSWSSMS